MKTIIAILFLLSSKLIGAHGENNLGPHNGYIRMPSTFHTELIQVSNNQFKVYLMDVNNQNQTNEKSSVDIAFNLKGKKGYKSSCLREADYFSCELKTNVIEQKGFIILWATRNGIIGKKVEYELPLTLKNSNESAHVGHDMNNM